MIDFNLPVITLPEVTDLAAVRNKYCEELEEYRREPEGSLEKIVELWDLLQVCETWMRNGGGSISIECYIHAKTVLHRYHCNGIPVMEAKAAMLRKNASRPRPDGGFGYYSPEDCIQILNSK